MMDQKRRALERIYEGEKISISLFLSSNSVPLEAASLPTLFKISFVAGCFKIFAIFPRWFKES